jgi:hypothetical protein
MTKRWSALTTFAVLTDKRMRINRVSIEWVTVLAIYFVANDAGSPSRQGGPMQSFTTQDVASESRRYQRGRARTAASYFSPSAVMPAIIPSADNVPIDWNR